MQEEITKTREYIINLVSQQLMKYDFKNHLAHIYIYAYDNRPEVVAKSYRSEAALFYFSKGVEMAKEIGNTRNTVRSK